MTDLIERMLNRLRQQLRERLSTPGDDGYAAGTAIWAEPVSRMPRAVVHCLPRALKDRPRRFRRLSTIEPFAAERGINGFSIEGEAWRKQHDLIMRALAPHPLEGFFPTSHTSTDKRHA